MTGTGPLIDGFMAAGKLEINQAKTALYWNMGATQIKKVPFYPLLAFIGPSGSGKSTNQRGLKMMSPANCYTFSCAGVTPASARDELAKAVDMIAVVEEFDQMSDQRGASRYFQARCDRATADIAQKEALEKGGYRARTVHLFGATIIHARNAMIDPALVSRSITLHTRHRPPPYTEYALPVEMFNAALESVDWSVTATGIGVNGRLYDTWYPVLKVAAGLGDEEWLAWAEIEIKLLQTRLEEAAGYDHRQVILAKVIETIADRPELLTWERVNVDESIGQALRKEYGNELSPWEVADTIKGLGFKTGRKGGRLWMYPTPSTVILACKENGYEDEWVDGIAVQIDAKFDL